MDCVFIDDFLVKFLEFGEIFDEIEVVYVWMMLEEFDSNNDGVIDKLGNYSIGKFRDWDICVFFGVRESNFLVVSF